FRDLRVPPLVGFEQVEPERRVEDRGRQEQHDGERGPADARVGVRRAREEHAGEQVAEPVGERTRFHPRYPTRLAASRRRARSYALASGSRLTGWELIPNAETTVNPGTAVGRGA